MNSTWFVRTASASVAAAFVATAAVAPAFAHITVSGPEASRGGSGVLVFRVPNESATGSPTVEFAVQIPGVTAVDTEAVPGWKAVVRKDSERNATDITWTADAGGGIGPSQFGQFSVLANGLPDTETMTVPAVQTYADGQVVRWDQKADGDGPEPERPAPSLTLAAKQSGGIENHGDIQPAASGPGSSSDTTARWLGGIGIALGGLGLLAALGIGVARRRS
ncbi:YcnI family copper-binding membrane protein [Nocardia amamiensis]|uniref:YcnI family copper-binding membrane protein n=1 Tax=Nocardia amamiensis TaxID=404578 RepID=UPI00082D92DC|nr:YcnI family protein [Nocardia amamiensis]